MSERDNPTTKGGPSTMPIFMSPYVLVYIHLLILAVSGDADFKSKQLRQIPVGQIAANESAVDLSSNLITRVENFSFVSFPLLNHLSLSHNEISFISDDAFTGTMIRTLLLDHNRLQALPTLTSIGSSLEKLNVDTNQIEFVAHEFEGLRRLQILVMSHNNITTIDRDAFSDCASTMHSMTFDVNQQLTSFPVEIFTGMSQLYHLSIQYVPITSFPDFRYLPKDNQLTRLYICHTHIGDLAANALYKLQKLEFLSLCGAGLTRVPDLSRQKGVLRSLALSFNNIKNITPNAFVNQTLSDLNLDRNGLTRLPDLHHIYPTLRSLYLKQNDLSSVTCEEFLELVANSPQLTYVDFSLTNIETFPDLLQLNRSFKTINLLNPSSMRCDCAMEWLTRLDIGVSTDMIGTSKPCAAPQRLVGKQWSTVYRRDLCFENDASSCRLHTQQNNVPLPRMPTTLTSDIGSSQNEAPSNSSDDVDIAECHVTPPCVADESREGGDILAAALGGGLGGAVLILGTVVILLLCCQGSSPNQRPINKHEGEDIDEIDNLTHRRDYMELVQHNTPEQEPGEHIGPRTSEVPVYMEIVDVSEATPVLQNTK